MKKIFFFAIATLGMMVGCQKTEIDNTQKPVEDSGRVAVKFNANVPSINVTKTKGAGAIDEWSDVAADKTLNILGYVKEAAFNSTVAGDILINNVAVKAPTTGTEGLLEVKHPEGTTYAGEPYFYADSKAYDFYGYYVDDAASATDLKTESNKVTIDVTIDGTQDIMAAKASPAYDIVKANASISEKNVYSAYAARRDVHPTLTFKHMLTRFQFYVVDGNKGAANATKVKVSKIEMESATAATLQVAPELALTNTTPDTKVYLPLAGVTETDAFTPAADFVDRNTPGGAKTENSIMVLPGEAAHKMKVTTVFANPQPNGESYSQPITPLDFTIEAADIIDPETASSAGLQTFQAGYQYDVIITVYGPEKVQITAVLSDWEDGGYTEYDPDKEMEEPETIETSVVAATSTSLTVKLVAPNNTPKTQVGASTTNDPADVTDWEDVVWTKALNASVTLTVEADKDYYIHVRTETGVDENGSPVYTNQEPEEDAEPYRPGDIVVLGSTFVHDAESFYTLPDYYKSMRPWNEYTEPSLPWLAVWFTPVKSLEVTAVNGTFTKTISYSKDTEFQVLTLDAVELELPKLTAGTWTLTLKSGSTTVTETIVVY